MGQLSGYDCSFDLTFDLLRYLHFDDSKFRCLEIEKAELDLTKEIDVSDSVLLLPSECGICEPVTSLF